MTTDEQHEINLLRYLVDQTTKLETTIQKPGRLRKRAITGLVYDIRFTSQVLQTIRTLALRELGGSEHEKPAV